MTEPTNSNPQAAEAPKAAPKQVERTSTLISNPAPATAPAAPVVNKQMLPQSTIDEMEAGRKALERNRPVAAALEQARDDAAKPKE